MKLHHYSDIPADNQISNCYHLEEDRKDLVKVNVYLLLTVKPISWPNPTPLPSFLIIKKSLQRRLSQFIYLVKKNL